MTKGKNILLSGGAHTLADLRAPLDVANLYVYHAYFYCSENVAELSSPLIFISITLLDVAQDQARNGLESTPKSLVLRARENHYVILPFAMRSPNVLVNRNPKDLPGCSV